MNTPHEAFAALVAAARGAIEWHLETGDDSLPVPEGFVLPTLGKATAQVESGSQSVQSSEAPPAPQAALIAQLAAAAADTKPQSRPSPFDAVSPATPQRSSVESIPISPEAVRPNWQPVLIDIKVGGSEMAQRAGSLQALKEQIGPNSLCAPHCNHTELVFGHGHPGARVLFVADSPGPREDSIGVPFVDEAGVLLGKMIRAMGLKRNDAYLTYLVKCYSTVIDIDTRLDANASVLATEIGIVKPEVIVTLGELAARRLTGRTDAFPHLRGKWFDYEGIPVLPTFHPQALLQHPQSKGQVWTDLKAVMRQIGLSSSGQASS
jgi:uracil-DNA glycosylase